MSHTSYSVEYTTTLLKQLTQFQLDDKLISLTNNNLNKFINTKKKFNLDTLVIKNKNETVNKNNTVNQNETFKPIQKSPLLWILFCHINDFNTYEYNKSNLYSIEQEFRLKIIGEMKKKKKLLKEYKLKYNNIEENIIYEKKLNLKSVKAICLLYNINLIYRWKRCFVNFKFNTNDEIILCENKTGIIIQVLSNVRNIACNYLKEYFEVTNLKKKILSVSSYVKKDLLSICEKLNINVYDSNGKEFKKNDLYSKILETI